MVYLRDIIIVLLEVEQTYGAISLMGLSEYVAMRNQLKVGETITVSLLSEAIHLMIVKYKSVEILHPYIY
jgi:hypothetical protein